MNIYLFGGKIVDNWRSILIDILTYSEKRKSSFTSRHLGILFYFLPNSSQAIWDPPLHNCLPVFLTTEQFSHMCQFVQISFFVSSQMFSEFTCLCLFAGAESVCTTLSWSYHEGSSHSTNFLHLTLFYSLNSILDILNYHILNSQGVVGNAFNLHNI